jgi:hypothetical protein
MMRKRAQIIAHVKALQHIDAEQYGWILRAAVFLDRITPRAGIVDEQTRTKRLSQPAIQLVC